MWEAPCNKYSGYVDLQGKVGSKRAIAEASFFMPLGCSENELLFMDIRPKIDTRDNAEGNFGMGYREKKETGVAGVYGYFDRRRSGETGAYHSQITLGAEWLADVWETRANIYVPITGSQTVGGGSSAPYLAGNSIFIDRFGRTQEEAMPGIDVEYGRTWQSFRSSAFTLNTGLYHFNGDETSNVNGARMRARLDIGHGTNLSLLGEAQFDNVRKEQFWGGIGLRIPFGKEEQKTAGLRRRMTELPIRDVDIVTSSESLAGGTEAVVNANTSTAQRVFYVDNSAVAGGDGTLEMPFHVLADAETAANMDYDIIYVSHGLGDSTGMDRGITLARDGQMLIGSGSDFTYEGERYTAGLSGSFNGAVLRAATMAPVLTNISANGDGVTVVAEDICVTGITVDGAQRDGISIRNAANAMIHNMTVSNNSRYGVYAYSNDGTSSGNLSMHALTATSNTNIASYVTASGAGSGWDRVEWHDATLTGSNARGIYTYIQNGAAVGSLQLDNVVSTDHASSTGRGLEVFANGAGSTLGAVDITDSTFADNTREGIYIQAQNNGAVGDLDISNVTASRNGNAGVSVLAQSSGEIGSVSIDQLTADDNTTTAGRGLLVNLNGASADVDSVRVTNSYFRNNEAQGAYIQVQNDANISDVSARNIVASGNTNIGFYVNAQTAGRMGSVDIEDVTANNNSNAGLYVYARSDADIDTVTISDITATGNTGGGGRGLIVNANGAGSTINSIDISNAVLSDNEQQGLYILSQTDAMVRSVTLDNLATERNSRAGVDVLLSGGGYIRDLDITNLTSRDNQTGNGRGLSISTSGAATGIDRVTVADSTLDANGGIGLYMQATAGAAMDNITLARNSTSNNANAGHYVTVQSGGSLGDFVIEDTVSSGNVTRGFYVQTLTGGSIDLLSFDGITANANTGSAGRGLEIFTRDTGSAVSNISVMDSTFNGNDSYGFYAYTATDAIVESLALRDTVTNNNASVGVYVSTQASAQLRDLLIEGAESSGNNNRGFYVTAGTGVAMDTITMRDLVANANTSTNGRGVEIAVSGAVVSDIALSDSVFNNNGSYGSYIVSTATADIGSISVQDHTTNGNANVGSYFIAQSAARIGDLTIDGLTADGNANTGVYLLAQSGGAVDAFTMTDIASANNTGGAGRGLRITSTGAGSVLGTGVVTGSAFTGNAAQGVYINAATLGVINSLTLTDSDVSSNAGQGLRIETGGTNADIVSLVARNMTLSDNGGEGLYVRATSSASISGLLAESLTITGNQSYGIYLDDDASGSYVMDFGGGVLGGLGQNRVFDNLNRDIRVDLDNGILKAENNWWGVSTGLAPAELQRDGSSNVDADPFLSVDPNP